MIRARHFSPKIFFHRNLSSTTLKGSSMEKKNPKTKKGNKFRLGHYEQKIFPGCNSILNILQQSFNGFTGHTFKFCNAIINTGKRVILLIFQIILQISKTCLMKHRELHCNVSKILPWMS